MSRVVTKPAVTCSSNYNSDQTGHPDSTKSYQSVYVDRHAPLCDWVYIMPFVPAKSEVRSGNIQ